MTRLQNIFEGGTDGVAISNANSGGASGDALDTFFTPSGGTIVYDDAQSAQGGLSALCNAASGANALMEWNSSWHSDTEVWHRMYFRFDNVSLTNHLTIAQLRSSDSPVAEVQLRNTNVIGLRDAALTLRYSSATSIAADTWYRLEWHVVHNASTGHMEARLFYGANLHGTTPDESFGSPSANWNTGSGSDEVSQGIAGNPGASGATMWLDGIAIDDVAWIGPASATYPAAVEGLAGVDDGSTELDLSWNVLAGAGGYDVERDGVIIATDVATNAYHDSGLSPGTEYDYRVRGVP